MRWAHLPNAGGLYDQHPDLLEKFRIIFAEQGKHDAREQAKRERENKRKGGGRRGASRSHM